MTDLTAPVLVACAHGTDSAAGRASIDALVDGVRRARPHLDVRQAFVDVQEPAVAAVVATANAEGHVAVVVPLLLSAGFHVFVDIAAAVADRPAAAAPALGPDDRLVDLLDERLRSAGARAGDAVVLAAAGSSDARAIAAVEHVRAALAMRWPEGPVTVGYCSAASPRVPDAVEAARAAGAGRVAIAAYLLAPGFFHGRLSAAGADRVADPLAADLRASDQRLVDVVLDRYDAGVAALRDRDAATAGPAVGTRESSG